jgi:lipopolysaccharide/colanic/teichoic acid biosynthesis glycosyltransferase
MITRIIDIFISILGLILFLLLLPIIAFLIKIDSRGPVLYKCNRIGLNGKIFKMFKFRTMYQTPDRLGPSLSPLGDPRVTPVGRVLRRLKLNEFPQFFNVLRGDMTLIGPRPESPDLAQAYPEYAKRIFTVKPGMVGPNQILGRNEEELYPSGVDPVKHYIEEILPRKIPVDLQYIDDKSLFKDLKYLFLAVKVTVTGAVGRRHLCDNRGQLLLLLCDSSLCVLSFSLAHLVRFEGASSRVMSSAFLKILPWTILVRLPIFIYFGFYHTLVRHLSLYDIKRVFNGVVWASLALVAFSFLSGFIHGYSRGVFLIDWFCLTTLLIGYRGFLKKIHLRYMTPSGPQGDKRKVLIWGAGDCGELCLRYLHKAREPAYEVVGFIDDSPQKRGKKLGGVKILGDRHHLDILSQLYKIQEVFVAMPSASLPELEQILEICCSLRLKVELFLTKFHINLEPPSALTYLQANNYYPHRSGEPRQQ